METLINKGICQYPCWIAISIAHWEIMASSLSLLLLSAGLQSMLKRFWTHFLDSFSPVLVNMGRKCLQNLCTICQKRPHEFMPAVNWCVMLSTLLNIDCYAVIFVFVSYPYTEAEINVLRESKRHHGELVHRYQFGTTALVSILLILFSVSGNHWKTECKNTDRTNVHINGKPTAEVFLPRN